MMPTKPGMGNGLEETRGGGCEGGYYNNWNKN